jgi:outer membrane protein TolC
MKQFVLFFLSLNISLGLYAQNTLTLNDCYKLAETNFPFTAQQNVLDNITAEAIDKINAIWQPQVYFNAQATYQSDVTSIGISIPGFEVQELSKDQYKATIDVNQIVYDGGISKQQRTVQQVNNAVESQKVNVDMFKIRERINQLYVIILQTDIQSQLINNLQNDLKNQEEKIKASQLYGTASQFQADILSAEIIKADQKLIEVTAARTAAISMLAQLIGQPIPADTEFELPYVIAEANDKEILRPELTLFDLQKEMMRTQMEFANAATLPKVSLFVQGGYGRPGLNFLDDTFQFYYIGGLKLNYPLWTGNTKQNDAAIYQYQMENIESIKQSFLININTVSEQYAADITKYGQLIEKDDAIITLKSKIRAGAQAQVDNGTMAADDYVKYITDETDAQMTKALHQMQLFAAQINYLNNIGK